MAIPTWRIVAAQVAVAVHRAMDCGRGGAAARGPGPRPGPGTACCPGAALPPRRARRPRGEVDAQIRGYSNKIKNLLPTWYVDDEKMFFI